MKVIDQINGSALFAQSAYSASVATKDSLGRDITSTYLTEINLPESATWNDTSDVVKESSASWNQGKTYEGISPIVVNNDENKVSADTWTFSAGSNVSLVDDNINNITRIDVTAQGGDPEVQNLVRSNSSTWDSVTNKLDTTAFSTVSGTFLTAVNIPESSTWNEVSTAYQNNSGTYLTAVDLSPYQTIAGMTAYQPVGSYATTNELEQVSADITAIIPSTAGLASESYVQTNSAVLTGMIDGKQDTLTFGYDEQDRISSINNSALAGGGDVPEDVMVESAIGYNSVNEISGYNGSAIAQYGAEKQWLVHDDTLVHAANSAQYALGVNVSALQRLMGIDETVLWTQDGNFDGAGKTLTFSEPASAFEKLEFRCGVDTQSKECVTIEYHPGNAVVAWHEFYSNQFRQFYSLLNINDTGATAVSGCPYFANLAENARFSGHSVNWTWCFKAITSIRGIGRKA